MEMKELNVTNSSEIQQLNSEEENEDLDLLRIDLLRKRIQKQEKSGQKYLIFVVALPLIGVISLSILGALNFQYNLFEGTKPIVDCSSDPCENGGFCTNVDNHFDCQCQPGWYGETCEKEIIKCSLDTCSSNGQCEDKENGFFCKCDPGWIGNVKSREIVPRAPPSFLCSLKVDET